MLMNRSKIDRKSEIPTEHCPVEDLNVEWSKYTKQHSIAVNFDRVRHLSKFSTRHSSHHSLCCVHYYHHCHHHHSFYSNEKHTFFDFSKNWFNTMNGAYIDCYSTILFDKATLILTHMHTHIDKVLSLHHGSTNHSSNSNFLDYASQLLWSLYLWKMNERKKKQMVHEFSKIESIRIPIRLPQQMPTN